MPIGTIATILVIAIFCNLALMVVFLLGPLVRRGRPTALPDDSGMGGFEPGAPGGALGPREPATRTIAWQQIAPPADDGLPQPAGGGMSREADADPANEPLPVARTAGEDATRGDDETVEEPEAESEAIDLDQPEIEETDRRRRFVLAEHDDPRAMRAIDALLSRPSANGRRGGPEHPGPPTESPQIAVPGRESAEGGALVDGETGLESPLAWERAFREEAARYLRYRRPVTVVVAEVDGFDRLVQLFGTEAAGRLVPPIAATLRRYGRSSDRIARVGPARFHALLPETDEVQAINYVERVRGACDRWLEAGAVGAHLILGWASPAADADVPAALGAAEQRLEAERRLAGERGRGADRGAEPSRRQSGRPESGRPESGRPEPGRAGSRPASRRSGSD